MAFVILSSIFVHQQVRQWSAVSGSEREQVQIGAGVSVKIDRRTTKTVLSTTS